MDSIFKVKNKNTGFPQRLETRQSDQRAIPSEIPRKESRFQGKSKASSSFHRKKEDKIHKVQAWTQQKTEKANQKET